MNNTKKSLKVLFIGESWHIHMIHSKGYDSFTSSKYEEGATWLLQCLKNSQVDVTYMPAHTVQIAFPEDVAQLEQYDAIVISDIGSNTFLLQNDTFYQLRIKPNALELIKEYVNNGGGLLMIGGYLSGFAPIFPDTCYHLTHYWLAAVDIPVASDNPVHYADAIRYNARTPLQGSLLPLTRLVWA
ncbi:hypothetical protein G967_02193 [Escherichia coli UMEA 3329-1]|nr:hypothetical protein G967_02193 [Escherichia coli UMEA 3329-1]